MTEEEAWLTGWFSTRCGLPESDIQLHDAENYFDLGWVDSFGVIDLIADAEARFGVTFTDLHFQDRDFATLKGMSCIINTLRQKQ